MLIALTCPSLAATLTVGASGDYPTIQAAVDGAAAGDTLQIDAGSWAEAVLIGKDLQIAGAGSSTVLTGTWGVSAGSTVSIADVAFTPASGRALQASGATLDLARVAFSGGQAVADGGAQLDLSTTTATVADSSFDGADSTGGNGGAIRLVGGSLEVRDSVFTGSRAEKGGGIWAYQTTLSISGCSFEENRVEADDEQSRGGAIRAQDSTVTILTTDFAQNASDGGYGAHVATYGGALSIEDSTFTEGEANDGYGGAIATTDTAVTLRRDAFTANQATIDDVGAYGNGGAVLIGGTGIATTTVEDCAFTDNVAEAFGGGIRVEAGIVDISGTTFTGNVAQFGGAAHIATISAATIESTVFDTNYADYGAGIRWRPDNSAASLALIGDTFTGNVVTGYGAALYARSGGELDVEASAFDDNTAAVGGALMVWAVSLTDMRSTRFCANAATGGATGDGGAITLYQGGPALFRNMIFVDNAATGGGGALNVLEGEPADVANSVFVGNEALLGGGLIARTSGISLQSSVVAWNTGDGLQADDALTATVTYNDFFENDPNPVGDALDPGALDPSNLLVDPLFTGFSDDGDCTNDDFTLTALSALIDAGDPADADPDGSRADIGVYGGPGADPGLFADTDGDGVRDVLDCEPENADVFPGAAEEPYDGIDQDCSGADLVDVDADGVAAEAAGGEDCDDTDSAVLPGATEVWYDGTDQDCDGNDADQDGDGSAVPDDCADLDDTRFPGAEDAAGDGVDQDCDGQDGGSGDTDGDTDSGKKCGCSTPGNGAGGGLMAIAALMLARRRAKSA